MDGKALGLVETYGYIGAIEAADICLKAAKVQLIGVELVGGGLVTVKINGDVGAVKAAIDAASVAVEKVGKLISIHVIPRPAPEIVTLSSVTLNGCKRNDCKSADCKSAESQEPQQYDIEVKKNETAEWEKTCKEEESVEKNHQEEKPSDIIESLRGMKVVELRSFARELDGINMERSHIKFAKREELLKAIFDYYGISDIE